MQNQRAINITVILTSSLLMGCNVSNEVVDSKSQLTMQNPKLVSSLCLASSNDDSEMGKRIDRQIKGIQILPNRVQNWVDLGNSWVKQAKLSNDPGFYLHTQMCIDQALKINGDYLPAQELKLQVLLNKHDFAKARKLAKVIVTKEPQSRLGWASLSDAQLELGNIEQAEESVEKLQDLQAGMAFFTRISYLSWLRGDIKAANDALVAALQRRDMRNPHAAAWTFVQGAEISWHRNDLVGAEALYNESLKWLPNYDLALMGLARIELARAKPRLAIQLLQKINNVEINAEATWLLIDAYEMAEKQIPADQNQAAFITLARQSDPLLLARFLATKNLNMSLALQLINKEKQGRGGIYIADTYAWILYRLGRFEEAQTVIEKALQWGTKDAKLLYHAGAIKIATGEITAGVALLHEALLLQPSFDLTGSKEAYRLIQQYGDIANV